MIYLLLCGIQEFLQGVAVGDWREAILDREPLEKYSWRFFSIELGAIEPGKHTIVSRAIDVKGRIQPTAQDDEIALKKTYWEAVTLRECGRSVP